MTIAVDDARRFFAEEIRVCANIRSRRIADALAIVPRERFLPPGPWLIRGVGDAAGPARWTEDADPRHVYHDVAIALDPERNLYNGQPSLIARWLDSLGLDEGQHVVHVGCGAGYFTAIIGHVVGPSGRVDAMDVDADLVARAQANLAGQKWVHARQSNGASDFSEDVDAIIVHAGATHVLDVWLDAMANGGRLLVPLTVEIPGMPDSIGKGLMILVTRNGNDWQARALGTMPVAIYSLKGLREDKLGAALGQAMMSGALMKATRVRRDAHEPSGSCVVHGPSTCLSQASDNL
jgi:protein-L-isoaspartate(D-aspartate) O-methyltransferase